MPEIIESKTKFFFYSPTIAYRAENKTFRELTSVIQSKIRQVRESYLGALLLSLSTVGCQVEWSLHWSYSSIQTPSLSRVYVFIRLTFLCMSLKHSYSSWLRLLRYHIILIFAHNRPRFCAIQKNGHEERFIELYFSSSREACAFHLPTDSNVRSRRLYSKSYYTSAAWVLRGSQIQTWLHTGGSKAAARSCLNAV